jgi:hypothetical protein
MTQIPTFSAGSIFRMKGNNIKEEPNLKKVAA